METSQKSIPTQLEVVEIKRKFKYKDLVLPEISSDFSVQATMDFYATQYPELTNASIADKGIIDDERVYEFVVKFANKG